MIFFRNLQLFEMLNFRRFIKTHTLTHTGKEPESIGQGQTEFFLSGPVFLPHLLADDAADGVCRVLLHLGCGVGVGVQGKPCRVVAQRAGQRFHDLRHTFATLALQNGVDIKTVSGMLGHFSAGFTLDTYAHVTTSAKREAAKTMGNILSGAV